MSALCQKQTFGSAIRFHANNSDRGVLRLQSLLHPRNTHRHVTKPLAGELRDRVSDGGCHRNDPDLAHAGRRIVADNDFSVDLWNLTHAQYRIVVEVRGLNDAILDCELLDERG